MREIANFGVLLAILVISGCVSETLSVGEGNYLKKGSVTYGPASEQKFQTYLPDSLTSYTPIVVFVPGGAWIRSDRKKYSFVGKALAKQGFIAVVTGYRVHPEVAFPAFVEDVAKVVAEVKKTNSPSAPIYLLGHSAGAHIAAMLTYDNTYLAAHGLDICRDIAGYVGLAGPLDFQLKPGSRHETIFPEDTRDKHMPMAFADAKTPPVLLIHGTSDKIVSVGHSQRFHAKLKSVGSSAKLKIYKGVGHVAILGAYSTVVPTSAKTVEDVAAFIRSSSPTGENTCQ